jgi:hypothetical protein
MGEPSQNSVPSRRSEDNSSQTVLALEIRHIKSVEAMKSSSNQFRTKAVEVEPVDRWIFRIVRQFGASRSRQVLKVLLQAGGIPAVKRQIEFLLFWAQTIRRGQDQYPS